MHHALTIMSVSTPSMVLRYAAAFFFVVVAIALVFALVRLGRTLGQAETMLGDINKEVVPLLKQATATLDNVNEELEKLDSVMGTVVDVTDKVDATTRAMEAAVSMPAKKAAAWGAGVSQAFSSMLGRRDHAEEPTWGDSAATDWRRSAAGPVSSDASSETAARPASPESATHDPGAGATARDSSAAADSGGPDATEARDA
jgi:hypothetical protein